MEPLPFGLGVTLWKVGVQSRAEDFPDLIRLDVSNQFLTQWGMILLVLGVAVGVLGSGIALRRFLREA